MTKLKSAEYWIESAKKANPNGINENIATHFIYLIRKEAIEAALEVAAEIVVDRYETRTGEAIDKQSITSLINHKDLKL